jgi:hypothetical protein
VKIKAMKATAVDKSVIVSIEHGDRLYAQAFLSLDEARELYWSVGDAIDQLQSRETNEPRERQSTVRAAG